MEVTKDGRQVIVTNTVQEITKVQPKFTQVVTQLSEKYEFPEDSIEQITATETINGVMYTVVVDQGDNTFSELSILTTDGEDEIEVTDCYAIPEPEILEI